MPSSTLSSIRRRIQVACAVAISLSIMAGSLSYVAYERLRSVTRQTLLIGTALRNHTLADMAHDGVRATVYAAIAARQTGVDPAKIRRDLEANFKTFKSAEAANGALDLTPQTREALARIEAPLASYEHTAGQIVDLALSNSDGAVAAIAGFEDQFAKLAVAMNDAADRIEREKGLINTDAGGPAAMAALLIFLSVLGIVSLSTILIAGMLNPFDRLLNTIRMLAGRNTEVVIDGAERNDEIGELARSINAFRQTIIENEQHEFEARRALQVVIDERREKESADRRHREALAAFMATFTTALERFSSGDLNYRLDQPYASDYEAIRLAFNTAADKVREAMAIIVRNSDDLRSGTDHILEAADELSAHTEAQAASLEETSASMEEMAATVRQNATNAQEANRSAAATRELAVGGGRIVNDAVAAMDKIEQSSRQITEIVVLIEEIAFQTNILALNAAVEAARAGDAGRGFSVVAHEVRALSQRSGQALKDVKSLIQSSSANVVEGVSLVKGAGTALAGIVGSVNKVADLVTEIAAASQEQATGIDQISRAVSSMDEMTQQNAGLVQETNAALHSARGQIEGLRAAIHVFDTGVVNAGQAPRTRREPARQPRPIVRPESAAKVARPGVQARSPQSRGPSFAHARENAADEEWLQF